MDLNYLYHRQQVSLMRADAAACVEARRAHLGLAREYREQIRTVQQALHAGTPALQG